MGKLFERLKAFLTTFFPLLPPLREVLSENGVGSYSRYMGFLIVVSTISWITYIVLKTKVIPDLWGPTLFITGGAASHYGINQVAAVFKDKAATEPAAVKGSGNGK